MSFTSQIQKVVPGVYNYFTASLNLVAQGQRLQNRINRKDGSYKVISNAHLDFVRDENNCDKSNLNDNDIVVIDDYIVKIYNKKRKVLEKINEEILIVTDNNDLYFYDQSQGKLIYLSPTTTTYETNFMVDNYKFSKGKKIKPNAKYQEMIRNKLKKEEVDVNQLDPVAIEYFSDYIASSSYTPIIFSMITTIVLYVIAMVMVAAGISLLFGGGLTFAIIVAITTPIASGVATITNFVKAIKNPDNKLAWAGMLSYASLTVGALLIALAVIFPPAAEVLVPVGFALTVIGAGGSVIVNVIKYRHIIRKYCKPVTKFFKEQKDKIIDWVKNNSLVNHLRNISYIGAFVTMGLFAAAVVCAFVFPLAVPFLLGAGTFMAVTSVGILAISKVIKYKNNIVGAYNKVKNFVKERAVPAIKSLPRKIINVFKAIPRKLIDGIKSRFAKWTTKPVLKKAVMQTKVEPSKHITEMQNLKIKVAPSAKQKPVKTSMIKAMMYNSMFTSVASCPIISAMMYHAHRSLHAATMLTVTAAVFGVFAGVRQFFHKSKKTEKNKVEICEKNKLVSICHTKLQDFKAQSPEIKISEVDPHLSFQPQTCRENTIANDVTELIKP